MHLHLSYPPTPENMINHAATAVEAAAAVEGIVLDYQVASLETVDGILDGFHREQLTPEQVGETVFSLGAYVGEVVVRANDGRWVTLPEDHPLGGSWPMVQLSNGTLMNPIGKAFKRMELGEGESIPYFYQVMIA